ncbi:hypothetical protein KP509_11G081100 [Ceratopteris richardii]|nr:hypothetical protein KP509_11G081100 [Ceratopteris richardii]
MGDSTVDAEAPPPPENKAPMKFSFTVSKLSSSSRPPVFPKPDRKKEAAECDVVEYVSVFDGQGRSRPQPAKVIPMPEKTWRPEKRMKNIMVASEGIPLTEEMFEVEALSDAPQPSVQYGLQLRTKPVVSAENPSHDTVDRDLQRFRDDIAVLPDEMSVDSYENIPVEEFGEALLRGMGWEKDKPIGRNATKVAEPVVPVRRVGREGLGAIPAPPREKVKKFIKPGESRTKITIGRIMCVITGDHAGSRGQIAEVSGKYYTIALLESQKRVRVKEEDLAEVGSAEEEKAIRKLSDLHIKGGSPSDDRSHSSKAHDREYHTKEVVRQDGQLAADTREAYDNRSGERHKSSHGESEKFRTEKVDTANDDRYKSKEASIERRTKSSQRESGKSSRDKLYTDSDGRYRKREDSSEKSNDRGRSILDDRDTRRHHSKHRYRSDSNTEGKEDYEEASRRQTHSGHEEKIHNHGRGEESIGMHGQNACEEKTSRYEEIKSRHTLDNEHELSSRIESKGHSFTAYKEKVSDQNNIVSQDSHAEDAGNRGNRAKQSWLARDIRVKIIDRKAYGDKYYLQKGCVVDVVSPSLCDIRIDNGGKILERVKQEYLETALPKNGGRVLVVGGKYRGRLGRLQERDSERAIGHVQMEEDYEILSFDLDDLAEYVGLVDEMEQ